MSDTDSDWEESQYDFVHENGMGPFSCTKAESLEVVYKDWSKLKLEEKEHACHVMKVVIFWHHILLKQQDNNATTNWAIEMGFLDSNLASDLSVKRLEKIEILESFLEAMDYVLSRGKKEKWERAFSLFYKSVYFEDCVEKAVSWLQDSGIAGLGRKLQVLGSTEVQFRMLHFIFHEYQVLLRCFSNEGQMTTEALTLIPNPWMAQKSEELKSRGNEQFQKKKYDQALKWYTKAIKYDPNNHILYGNRALCLIRSEKYLKALGDGKRAMVLQPDWAKGHYRFCDAMFYLGQHQKAAEANKRAQRLCSKDTEGLRELQQQLERFHSERNNGSQPLRPPDDAHGCASAGSSHHAEMKSQKTNTKKASKLRAPVTGAPLEPTALSSAPENLKAEQKQSNAAEVSGAPELHADGKSSAGAMRQKKVTEKPVVREKVLQKENIVDVKQSFRTNVRDGHTTLINQRFRNACSHFSLALSILESAGVVELGVTELDRSVLMYGHAAALLEVAHPEELAEARRLLKMLESCERKFQLLVFYGMGRVCVKENRFTEALEQFSNALLMLQRHITPGKLTWPTTNIIVEETQPELLKERLENFLELCRFPPKADALCRHQHCLSSSNHIYFSDPDFKGFIQLSCCQSCRVEFHISCWKKLKTLSFIDKNDKDFLKNKCFTPDCGGQIRHIVIFGPTGLIKCEFEASILKVKNPGRPTVRQPCTSFKKIKRKTEQKLRRKEQKLSSRSVCLENKEALPVDADLKEVADTGSTTSLHHPDRVLHEIHEKKEVLKGESVNISAVAESLQPWWGWCDCDENVNVRDARTLSELVDHLLESENRVCARVFVEALTTCLPLQSELQRWARRLDSAGLRAASSFLTRYSSHLQELDLSDLRDVLSSVNGLYPAAPRPLVEQIAGAAEREKRVLVWALEARRHLYPNCHSILQQFFQDDTVSLVIKKTDEQIQTSVVLKSKKRQKKLKQKDKLVMVLSGVRAGHPREEEEEFFSEEDALMWLNSTDPFAIPLHLRDELELFEQQFSGSSNDIELNTTTETLYEYFVLILEQHGPLRASDPLMVSELENFPVEAQQQIADAGGLESFLLESQRFIKTDDLIVLHERASCQRANLSQLNSSAEEFRPQTKTQEVPAEDRLQGQEVQRENCEDRTTKHKAVCAVGLSSRANVWINTEPLVPFEKNNGDLMVNEKEVSLLLMEMTRDGRDELQEHRKQQVSALEDELQNITQQMQVASYELGMFQQQLEEEVHKHQQEKKENQEALKKLKTEIKELVDFRDRCASDVQEKKRNYQSELDSFLEIGNQCASERMCLEDEVRRLRSVCTTAESRSLAAQLRVLRCRRDVGLRRLRLRAAEGRTAVQRLAEAARSNPGGTLAMAMDEWNRHVRETEDAISRTTMEFEAQIEQVKTGTRLCSLPVITFPSIPSAPHLPALHPSSGSPSPSGHNRSPVPDIPAAAPPPPKPYERILQSLQALFPHHSRSELSRLLQDVRATSGGSLSCDDVINRAAQLILDRQESGGRPGDAHTHMLSHAWKNMPEKQLRETGALNTEDPCIICHDDMSAEDVCVLECRHSFHRECIKSWLREQSTCPTCRDHALLPEDFPQLPGRQRGSYTPWTPSL